MLLSRGAIIDARTHRHLRLRAPMRYLPENGKIFAFLVPSNARPLRRLVHKYYSILVRLHVIGTPTSRPGPDRRRLAASSVAPLVAAFLVPEPISGAAEFWAEGERASGSILDHGASIRNSATGVYESEDEPSDEDPLTLTSTSCRQKLSHYYYSDYY